MVETYFQGDLRYYGQSKLAQIVWTKFPTERLGADSNIYFNACHPGGTDTSLIDKLIVPIVPTVLSSLVEYARKNMIWTAEEGALTQVYLGTASNEGQGCSWKVFPSSARRSRQPTSIRRAIARGFVEVQ